MDAGKRKSRDASVWTGIEPGGEAWRSDFYTYRMEPARRMTIAREKGSSPATPSSARGRPEQGAAGHDVRRCKWLEKMVKVNDPVAYETESKCSGSMGVGDQIFSHLGAGFRTAAGCATSGPRTRAVLRSRAIAGAARSICSSSSLALRAYRAERLRHPGLFKRRGHSDARYIGPFYMAERVRSDPAN